MICFGVSQLLFNTVFSHHSGTAAVHGQEKISLLFEEMFDKLVTVFLS